MQDNYCTVKCSPTKRVLGEIKTCLFPSEAQDFPERRKSDWGHQQLSLCLGTSARWVRTWTCHVTVQAADQVIFGNCGFVEASAFLSANI